MLESYVNRTRDKAAALTFMRKALIRLESVQNANDQATVLAKAITGQEMVYRAVPWFWFNQYNLKLQTVGLSAGMTPP